MSAQGRMQLAGLSGRIKDLKFDHVYSSDRKRAVQSARVVFGKRRIIMEQGLREIDFGVLEGMKHGDILKKYGAAYRKWLADPYKGRIPKAETMAVFKKRVRKAIKTLAQRHPGGRIAVVCHGGVIGIMVSSIFKSIDFWRYVPAPASLTMIEYSRGNLKVKKWPK